MLTKKYWLDRDMQQMIGSILRYGVLISAVLVLTGGIIYLLGSGQEQMNYSEFLGSTDALHTVTGILHGAAAFQGTSIIQLGVVVLIATPIARVLCSLLVFAIEKDYLYIVITLIVLLIIFYSMTNKVAH